MDFVPNLSQRFPLNLDASGKDIGSLAVYHHFVLRSIAIGTVNRGVGKAVTRSFEAEPQSANVEERILLCTSLYLWLLVANTDFHKCAY